MTEPKMKYMELIDGTLRALEVIANLRTITYNRPTSMFANTEAIKTEMLWDFGDLAELVVEATDRQVPRFSTEGKTVRLGPIDDDHRYCIDYKMVASTLYNLSIDSYNDVLTQAENLLERSGTPMGLEKFWEHVEYKIAPLRSNRVLTTLKIFMESISTAMVQEKAILFVWMCIGATVPILLGVISVDEVQGILSAAIHDIIAYTKQMGLNFLAFLSTELIHLLKKIESSHDKAAKTTPSLSKGNKDVDNVREPTSVEVPADSEDLTVPTPVMSPKVDRRKKDVELTVQENLVEDISSPALSSPLTSAEDSNFANQHIDDPSILDDPTENNTALIGAEKDSLQSPKSPSKPIGVANRQKQSVSTGSRKDLDKRSKANNKKDRSSRIKKERKKERSGVEDSPGTCDTTINQDTERKLSTTPSRSRPTTLEPAQLDLKLTKSSHEAINRKADDSSRNSPEYNLFSPHLLEDQFVPRVQHSIQDSLEDARLAASMATANFGLQPYDDAPHILDPRVDPSNNGDSQPFDFHASHAFSSTSSRLSTEPTRLTSSTLSNISSNSLSMSAFMGGFPGCPVEISEEESSSLKNLRDIWENHDK